MVTKVWKERGLWHARVPDSGSHVYNQAAARQAIKVALMARDLIPLGEAEIPVAAVSIDDSHAVWRTVTKYGHSAPVLDDFYPGQHMEIVGVNPDFRHFFVIGDVVEYVRYMEERDRHVLQGHTLHARNGRRGEYPETQFILRGDFRPTDRGLTDHYGDEIEEDDEDMF